MKTTLALILLTLACSVRGNDYAVVRLKTLAAIPEKRHAALVLYAASDRDSTPALSEKRGAYYLALRRMAEELKAEYFWHDQFPSDVFAGIENRADVLVATQYPLSPTTGCTYVDYLRDTYRNIMAEEVIISMARAICAASKESNIQVEGKPARVDFDEWYREWQSAASFEGALNPPKLSDLYQNSLPDKAPDHTAPSVTPPASASMQGSGATRDVPGASPSGSADH